MKDGYEWLSLDAGESVQWHGQPRVKSIIPAVLVGIPMILALGLGILVMAGAYLSVKNTYYAVTSDALYVKKGILSRSVQRIEFSKVQNISFSQGILGSRFGYGNVEISTAGGSGVEMRFRSIQDPRKVQQLINEKMKPGTRDQESSSESSSGRTEKEVLEEILSEVKDLNSKI